MKLRSKGNDLCLYYQLKTTSVWPSSLYNFRGSIRTRVGDIEVVLPFSPVSCYFPRTGDGVAVVADFPFEALKKIWVEIDPFLWIL
jgi:hypothetical protein